MALALVLPDRDTTELARDLRRELPEAAVEEWPHISDPDAVRMAVAWHQPEGVLSAFPNLEAVSSFGAGVDGLIFDPSLPRDVVIGRIVYPGLIDEMAEYVAAVVLARRRRLWEFAELKRERRWRPRPPVEGVTVGLLGLGELGGATARTLRALGLEVLGWSRTPKDLEGVESFTGDEGLTDMAARSDYLVCLLPLTPRTEGVLNRDLFAAARPGCYLINAGRGRHLVERDLLEALESGQLAGACLDAFAAEPLPEDHPFWTHPAVQVTPHVASLTDPRAAAAHVAEDYRRVLAGKPLQHPVPRERGY